MRAGGAGKHSNPQPAGAESLARNSQFPPLTFLTASNECGTTLYVHSHRKICDFLIKYLTF